MKLRFDLVLEATAVSDRVIVVGFGPVGAVAALALAQRGVPVTVLEGDTSLRTDPSESRASTFHPPTLEMLDNLGVFEELHATGLVADTYQLRDRTKGVIAHFDLKLLAGDTRFPYRLQNEQQNLVAIIATQLRNLQHVQLLYDSPLLDARLDGDIVELDVGGNHPRQIQSRHVIAADGASSAARRALAIDFVGMTYPERFLVASTTEPFEDLLPGLAPVNYISDELEWLVLLRTPRHWRALFPTPDNVPAATVTEPAAVQGRLQRVAAVRSGYQLSHTTLYQVHQRVASSFRRGSLLLAGDAAHVNNPLGGMGMNSGIHDALAAVEAIVADADGDSEAMDRYDTERRKVALEYVQRATHRNWEQMQERDPKIRARRNSELQALAEDPVAARQYLLISSMLAATAPLTSEQR